MARGQAGASNSQLKFTNAVGQGLQGQSGDIYSSLVPQLQGMAASPQGYSPTDLNAMRTGSMQSLGGATSGIVGTGALEAARTRNSAGIPAALDQAARAAGQNLSENELGIETANADLKQKQQQQALSALGGLYGTSLDAATKMYGLGPSTLQARAAGPGWSQGFKDVVGTLMPKGV